MAWCSAAAELGQWLLERLHCLDRRPPSAWWATYAGLGLFAALELVDRPGGHADHAGPVAANSRPALKKLAEPRGQSAAALC